MGASPTKNPALWGTTAVGAQGPQGPPGPNGVLLDTWWVSVDAPNIGVGIYVRRIFDGNAIQLCGAAVPGYELAVGAVYWCGYLPPGYQVTGDHWNPILAYGTYGWTAAALRINYDYPQLVAVEAGDRPASQFYLGAPIIALGGTSFY